VSDNLNAGQRAVLESTARRIVVSAGAGSGKTRVLAERFVDRVLRQESVRAASPMRSVLLITFTDKAAGELSERVRRLFLEGERPDLAREVDTAWISTIHGFCARIVRRHAFELGVDPAFGILAEPQVGVVRSASFEAAALGLLEEPDLSWMIDERGVAGLRSSLLTGYDTMRAKGGTVADVLPATPGDLQAALADLERVLDETLPAYRALSATPTIAANLESFATLRGLVAGLGDRTVDPLSLADRARAAEAAALVGCKGRCQGGDAMKQLTQEVNDALARVGQAVIDTTAARWSAAWCRLLAAFDQTYAHAKAALGVLDFEDLQLLTRRLWAERPETAARYGRQFVEVMIDEFQDTNRLQADAIEPVAGTRLCVVGDVQQSIYRFRDADVALFQERRRSAEAGDEGQGCRLTVNYRSNAGLLSAFNGLFCRDEFFGTEYLPLEYETARPGAVDWPAGGPRAEVLVVDKSLCESGTWREVEAAALATRIRAIVDEGRVRAGDVVVLVRSTTTMRPYVQALEAAGFDVLASAAGGFYGTPELADVRALLRVLTNPLDNEGVLDLLAGGLGGVSDDALFLLAAARSDHGLWAALAEAGRLDLDERDADRAALVRETIEWLRAHQGRIRLADALLHAVAVLGPGGGCLSRAGGRENLQKAARIAAEFERTTPADPAAFLRHLGEREAFVRKEAVAGAAFEGGDAIRVMTVHAAKGLEFPVVAVADLGHGQVATNPGVLLAETSRGLVAAARGPALGGDRDSRSSAWSEAVAAAGALDAAEAKRVFYVAATRAQEALLLSGSVDLTRPRTAASAIEWVLDATEGGAVPDIAVSVVEARPDGAREALAGAEECAALPRRAPEPHPTPKALAPELLPSGPIRPPSEMSYTALALFESCAYRFFAERMLKVGAIDVKRADDPRIFGSTLHRALDLIARGEEGGPQQLAALARASGLSPDEVPRLVDAVTAVRESPAGRLLAPGRPEVEFALPVGTAVVRGSMDLLVRERSLATVLDYKTGRTWDAEGGRYAAQAEVYALVLLEDGCESVQVRFVHVEAGCEEAVFDFTPADADRIRSRIEQALERMSSGAFPPRSAFDPDECGDCPVSGGLCPVVRPKGRSRRAG
jgi:ATP-dependent exoDNAse (exonuclease V) beta subunit